MSPSKVGMKRLFGVKRWLYRGDRPGRLARVLNVFWRRQYARGGRLARQRDVQLEVMGRRSGRMITFPVVLADVDDRWYAVSMLGDSASWVRNVRAADGQAVMRHGESRSVTLVEVPPEHRAPILKRYLEVAPGARPHFSIDRTAPLTSFAEIAGNYPVFEVVG